MTFKILEVPSVGSIYVHLVGTCSKTIKKQLVIGNCVGNKIMYAKNVFVDFKT